MRGSSSARSASRRCVRPSSSSCASINGRASAPTRTSKRPRRERPRGDAMPSTAKRQDPIVAAFFKVEVDSIDMGTFQQGSGLKTGPEVSEYQEGGDNERVHKLVGQSRASNIVLSNGYIVDPALFKWREEIAGR